MKVLTVEQAVERVNKGGNLQGIVLDKNTLEQVNVRDAMVLSSGGIVIPEQNIYYDDADIQYDEDIDELTITSGIVNLSWEEKAKRAAAQQKQTHQEADATLEVQLHLDPEIKTWLDQQPIAADKLIESLLDQFYHIQQMIKKK